LHLALRKAPHSTLGKRGEEKRVEKGREEKRREREKGREGREGGRGW
jgi:hypothetical protein